MHTHSEECYQEDDVETFEHETSDAQDGQAQGDMTSETQETQDTYNDESAAVSEEDAGSESYVPEPQSPNMEFKSGTLLADGDGYKVRLDYTEEAQIPGDAVLSAREITAETDEESYEACLAQAREYVSKSGDEKTDVDTQASRFFDIEILVTGEDRTVSKIEPAAPVQVSMLLPEAVPEAAESEAAASEETASEEAVSESESGEAQKTDPRVLHFVKNGVEQVDPAAVTRGTFEAVSDAFTEGNGDETDRDAGAETRVSRDNDPAFEDCEVIRIRFEAGSFSVYGIVYTVYTVDSVDSRYESRDENEKENEKEKESESPGLSLSKKGGSSKTLRGPAEDSQPMNLAEFVTDAVIEIEGRTYGGGETWTVHEDVNYALTLTFK